MGLSDANDDGEYFTYIAQTEYGEEIWILVPSK